MKWNNYSINQVLVDSQNYPQQLKRLPDPPKKLYYRGSWDKKLFEKTLAIVGSRRASGYGERVLDLLIPNLVAEGITIISGFMYGIDTLAHQKCLECGGKTIAVLGGGLNVLYPPENEELYLDIIGKGKGEAAGLILSEYPSEQQPQLWTFPQRNRIVAALSTLGVLVIEAGEKSGSLITAKIAKKLGKPLFAVPGPITSSISKGTNQLIKDGLAKMILGADDIVGADSCPRLSEPKPRTGSTHRSIPTDIESQIINLLSLEPLTLDELALKLNKDIIGLGQTLTFMTLKGIVFEDNGKLNCHLTNAYKSSENSRSTF